MCVCYVYVCVSLSLELCCCLSLRLGSALNLTELLAGFAATLSHMHPHRRLDDPNSSLVYCFPCMRYTMYMDSLRAYMFVTCIAGYSGFYQYTVVLTNHI